VIFQTQELNSNDRLRRQRPKSKVFLRIFQPCGSLVTGAVPKEKNELYRSAMISMSPQPDTGEVLAGLVERVTSHNIENGFCVLRARARGHRDVVTVVGHAAAISAGEWIMASGPMGQ
jgi:hypothetical protein